MSYAPTTWVEKVTKVGPTNLNHLEGGVQAAAAVADAAQATANAALPTPAGTDGQFLQRVSGVWVPHTLVAADIPALSNAQIAANAAIATSKIDWSTNLAVKAKSATAQTLSTGVGALVVFGAEDFDTAAMHDTVTNNTRITFATAGVYALMAGVEFDGSAAGLRTLSFQKNGATIVGITAEVINNGASPVGLTNCLTEKFAAGDYIEVVAAQNAGGNLNIGTTHASFVTAVRVAA
jgi:hypothetical protein